MLHRLFLQVIQCAKPPFAGKQNIYHSFFTLFREYNKVMHQPIALNIFRQNADVFIVIHYTENLVIRVGSDINQRNIFIIVFNFSVLANKLL